MAFVPLNTNNSDLANYNSVNSLMLDYQGFKKTANGNFADGWISGVLPSVSSVTANGNRSYDITFSGDVSSYLSPGMRLKTVRQVAAPTQCTSLNGSTQYWSDSTVSGFTATDDVTFMAWIYLTSYSASSQDIVGRGAIVSSGCGINLAASSGLLQVFGFAAGPTYRIFTSYQTIPLNKWVHVAGTLNMSAGAYKLYIDGTEVPGNLGSSGTPSAFVNTGDLWVGRRQSGTTYFNGKIAQAAIFSSVLSEATIKQYMTQGLTGTESTLVSAYSFNGTADDLNTTNANNLTASGSAVATNSDSPFSVNGSGTPTGTDDYAIVQKVSTTVATVQVPTGCTIPTSGGIAASYISTTQSPFNWITDKSRWILNNIYRAQYIQSSPVQNTWYNLSTTSGTSGGMVLSIPKGNWDVGYYANMYCSRASGSADIYSTLSTANNTESDRSWTTNGQSNPATDVTSSVTMQKPLSVSAQTSYYLNTKTAAASVTALYQLGDRANVEIFALPSGL